jgi:hypothetical protein
MTGWVLRGLSAAWTRLRQRRDLLLEFIALRHQLAVLQRTGTRRPCFRPSERLFWLFLSRWWGNWQRSLIIVQPATVLRWRRLGLWAICLSGSCGHWRGGRPRINSEIRVLNSPDEPRELLMGRAADPCRAAETWIRCLASHSVPLHATAGLSAHPDLAHLPAEPGMCNRHDRSRRNRSAIGRACCSRPRMDRGRCPVRYEGAGWLPLRVYRAIIDLAPGAAISLIGATLIMVPCRSLRRPPL